MGYFEEGYGLWFLGGFFMVLFWGAIILLIVWLVGKSRPETNYSSTYANIPHVKNIWKYSQKNKAQNNYQRNNQRKKKSK